MDETLPNTTITTDATLFREEAERARRYAAAMTLHREGEQTPKMMTVAVHCRLAGKPARAAAFARFVDHVLRHDGVWICRRSEIAEHWRRQHPATGKKG